MTFLILFSFSSYSYQDTTELFISVIKSKYPHLQELIIKLEDSSDFMAKATRDSEKRPLIVLSNDYLKRFGFKTNEILLLLCHELGHFEAGAPYKKRGRSELPSWSSAEGQADYYSTLKCIKHFDLCKIKPAQKYMSQKLTDDIYELCSNKDSCCKNALKSIFHLIASYREFKNSHESLDFIHGGLYPVYYTILDHPSLQCRLDTLTRGYFCSEYKDGECQETSYVRPNCWFGK